MVEFSAMNPNRYFNMPTPGKHSLVAVLEIGQRRYLESTYWGIRGLALQDINGDGFCDIYVCEPHGMPNLLFIQNSNGTVEEVGASSNVNILDECRGALIVDLNNDGDQDLAITSDQCLILTFK